MRERFSLCVCVCVRLILKLHEKNYVGEKRETSSVHKSRNKGGEIRTRQQIVSIVFSSSLIPARNNARGLFSIRARDVRAGEVVRDAFILTDFSQSRFQSALHSPLTKSYRKHVNIFVRVCWFSHHENNSPSVRRNNREFTPRARTYIIRLL